MVLVVTVALLAPVDAAATNTVAPPRAAASPGGELLYSTEGNRLRRYDVDTIGTGGFAEDVLVERAADDPQAGRDINGEICALPDGSGRFIAGEDTGQPTPPAGWGVFAADGTQVGKLTATYNVPGAEPFGCEFGPDGNLFTSEVGFQGFGTANGQLIIWFPPYDGFPGPSGTYPDTNEPSTNFCKLATDLGTAGAVAVDGQGRVYVSQSSLLSIERFSPPFPTGPDAAGGCGGVDATGAPMADTVQRETFATPSDGMLTFSGIALAPNGNLYASSVLTGRIAEYDLEGNVVRLILAPEADLPPIPTGHPQGLAVGRDGSVYYADLDLVGTLPNVRPGPNGKVWRIAFDADDEPLPPMIVREGLAFPDGVAIIEGDLERADPPPPDWPTLAGGPERRFFNPGEQWLTADNTDSLVEKWRFATDAVVTSSPSVSVVDLPGRGPSRVVFFTSWDGFFYAADFDTGEELWRVAWEDQPGSSFPAAASPTVADIGGQRLVFVAAGEHLYALDAATGAEAWRFAAGTGCRDATTGVPPGLCSFIGERNQIESTPLVAGGTVYVGMDVNDVATGKGGFFAIDAESGTLVWYFDVETGSVCRPRPSDQVRRFDGYHSEQQLGLAAGFLTSRSGCGHDRTTTGCGNVWSSAAHDRDRGLLFFGTSNCDTDADPATPTPGPTMPPYDEALVALRMDGRPAWRWRPREVDNDDLAFGAAPNLFTIDVDGQATDVVGIGNKDGTYYVVDRDGVNARNGVTWNDPDPTGLPYWATNVVPGGAIGGIIATASVDEATRRVFFSTAPGLSVGNPQRPTVHALDLDTGAVVWQNRETSFPAGDASYGATSGVPGVVLVGSVITPHLRMYDASDGTLLFDENIGQPGTLSGIASGTAVIDGTLLVGAGIGSRTSSGSSPGDFAANTPSALIALCVPGTLACPGPAPTIRPGLVEVAEGDRGIVTARVPVSLSFPSQAPVTVAWETFPWPGTATAPDDLVSASGTVTFAPGQTTAVVEVSIVGDREDEDDEIALVRFHQPTNATVGGFFGLGAVRILDDDPPPILRPRRSQITEGDLATTELRIPVRLSRVSGREVQVSWRTVDGTATAPTDYLASSGRLLFAPGQRNAEIVIEVVGDTVAEPRRERLSIDFVDPVNATIEPARVSVIIVDDD